VVLQRKRRVSHRASSEVETVDDLPGGVNYHTKITFSALVSRDEVQEAVDKVKTLQQSEPEIAKTPAPFRLGHRPYDRQRLLCTSNAELTLPTVFGSVARLAAPGLLEKALQSDRGERIIFHDPSELRCPVLARSVKARIGGKRT
jgi:hypothetical protein